MEKVCMELARFLKYLKNMAHYFFSGNDPESLDVIEPSQETEESNTTDQGNLLRSIANKTVRRLHSLFIYG